MRLAVFFFALCTALSLVGQETESTLTAEVDTVAGTAILLTEVAYAGGARATYRTDTMSLAEAAELLRTIHERGGQIGLADYRGQRALTEAYQQVIQANRIDREHRELEQAWTAITGTDWQTGQSRYDDLYVGDWTLETPLPLLPVLQLSIFRNANGTLRFSSDLAGNGRVDIEDQDRIILRGLGDESPITLTKRNARRNVLFSADRQYQLAKN